jgi:palmitoyltransferase ZDHHC4
MQLVSVVIIVAPYVFLFLAAFANPGYVTRETHSFYGSLYPYDHTLYLPGNICRTCKHTKPARSKHCSICGYCVAKADHHCIFINSCVGYGNQHWFLLLLMFTGVLTTAGTILGGHFVFKFIKTLFPSFSFIGGNLSWAQYFAFWSFGLAEEAKVGGVTLLCLLTTPLVWALLGYNMYLLYRGMTTNESGKWQDFQADVSEGYIFRRPLSPSCDRDRSSEARLGGWPKMPAQTYVWMDAPPRIDNTNLPDNGTWHRNPSLADVDNTYDIGLVGNMLDVFLPRSYLKSWYENEWWRH